MKNSLENQSNISKETPIIEIVKIDFHLVRPNDIVIVPFWVVLLGKQFLFVTVFDAGWTRDAWTKLQNTTVITLQLVSIARHIGAWPDETHLADKYIYQFGEAINLTMA